MPRNFMTCKTGKDNRLRSADFCHGIVAISLEIPHLYKQNSTQKNESENVCLIREKIFGWTCQHYMEREHDIDIRTY